MLKNNCPFEWEDNAKIAFAELRTRFANAFLLIYPNLNLPFLLEFDALKRIFGAVLSQLGKDQLKHPVAYFSCTLGKHERNYSQRMACCY